MDVGRNAAWELAFLSIAMIFHAGHKQGAQATCRQGAKEFERAWTRHRRPSSTWLGRHPFGLINSGQSEASLCTQPTPGTASFVPNSTVIQDHHQSGTRRIRSLPKIPCSPHQAKRAIRSFHPKGSPATHGGRGNGAARQSCQA